MYKSNLMDEWEKTHNSAYHSGSGSDAANPAGVYASGSADTQEVYARHEEQERDKVQAESDSLLDNLDLAQDYKTDQGQADETSRKQEIPAQGREATDNVHAGSASRQPRSLDDAIDKAIRQESSIERVR